MSKLQQAMDLLREYCASRGDDDFVVAVESEIAGLIAQADMSEQARKTPIAWACWIDDADPENDIPQLSAYEPTAYRQRVPLIAVKELADMLAAEREVCANICDHEQGTAGDAAEKIRMRSSAEASWARSVPLD